MKRTAVILHLFVICAALFGQRVPAIPANGRIVALAGHLPPLAAQGSDQGPIDPSQRLGYVSLIFRRTAAQQADLDRLLQAQRTAGSPEYLRWLTPAQFAARFAIDAASLSNVRQWLEAKGFVIEREAESRTSIAFSGTAAQIDNVFGTELHTYTVRGRVHFAPTRDPSVPEALQPAILAIQGLDDFTPEHTRTQSPFGPGPSFTSSGGGNYLTPDDLATIYDVAPLYGAGFTGTGQTIAIVGESSVNLTDIANFQTKYGLPTHVPQVIAVADPSIPPDTDTQSEAALDLELSAAIARDATQIFVYSTNVIDAATYVVDHVLAPVMSMSFHACEKNFTSSVTASLTALGQESASKGITWIVSSGDSGPADCDAHDVTGAVAQNGISVNGLASNPEVTAVGGTEFNEASTLTSTGFWNGINGSNLGSAIGYIPETAWNDSALAGYIAASGGGSSRLFSKPAWQTGAGVPTDGARDVPDVALAASWFHDSFALCNDGTCTLGSGGTSAATPMFAGMVVLLNQFLMKWNMIPAAGLGNINQSLYQLAQTPAYSFAFHDIVNGSNVVPCLAASPNCATGSYGYFAGPNYDLVTGLGSVDALQLFSAWLANGTHQLMPTSTTAVPSSVTLTSSTVTEAITVTVTSGGNAAPGGTVSLTAGPTILGSSPLTQAAGSSTANFTIFTAQLPPGTTTITAFYNGNAGYLPSSASFTIALDGAATAKPSVQVSINPTAIYETPAAYGNAWNFTLTLREVNGVAANLVGLKVNTIDTTQIANQAANAVISSWFGTTMLTPYESISVPLQLTMPGPSATSPLWTVSALGSFGSGAEVAAPATALASVAIAPLPLPGAITIEVDIPGHTSTSPLTSSTASVPVMGRPGAASLVLAGVPSAVLRNPGGGTSCPWSQQLLLSESAGTGVTLKHFIAGGNDMSNQIETLWGSTRIAGNTEVTAPMCWSGISAPLLINYQLSGTDDNGNAVSASMTSPFLNQPAAPNSLNVTWPNPALSGTLSLNTANEHLLLQVAASSLTQVWTVTVSANGQSPKWLTVYPLSGTGPGNVAVAPAAGLASGTYNASILFQSADAEPQVFSVPVTFTVE